MVQSQATSLTIARLASAGGVGVETIRFYQRKQLLRTPPSAGTIRRYDAEDVRQLHFIRNAQAAGFSLAEIKELLNLDLMSDRPRAQALARERLAALDKRIAELHEVRHALRKLADRCAAGEGEQCPILAEFGS